MTVEGKGREASLELVATRLRLLFDEMRAQEADVATMYESSSRGFDSEFDEISEYLNEAHEFGIAYEVLVCNLEFATYVLSAKASLALLEVGLLFGFKTERASDEIFDRRSPSDR